MSLMDPGSLSSEPGSCILHPVSASCSFWERGEAVLRCSAFYCPDCGFQDLHRGVGDEHVCGTCSAGWSLRRLVKASPPRKYTLSEVAADPVLVDILLDLVRLATKGGG